MDVETRAFFRRAQEEPENQLCVDTSAANPQWASLSHGCYISLEASGVHRSLGVHISFVRSTTMDSWKPQQLKLMELGGNDKLKSFFRQHGVPDKLSIKEKYNTQAAAWYRRHLRARADGAPLPEPLPPGIGHLPADAPGVAQARLAGSQALPAQLPLPPAARDSRRSPAGSPAPAAPSPGSSLGAADRGAAGQRGGGLSSLGPSGITGAGGFDGRSSAISSSSRGDPGAGAGYHGAPGTASAPPLARDPPLFGSTIADRAAAAGRPGETAGARAAKPDVFADFFGADLGSKVSAGVRSTVGLLGDVANKASASAPGGADVLGRTGEVLGGTVSAVGSSVDWVAGQFGLGSQDSSQGLHKMSSGTMEGFGSQDGTTPSAAAAPRQPYHGAEAAEPPRPSAQPPAQPPARFAAGSAAQPPARAATAGPGLGPSVPVPLGASPLGGTAPLGSAALARGSAAPPKKAVDLWNHDDWGDWR